MASLGQEQARRCREALAVLAERMGSLYGLTDPQTGRRVLTCDTCGAVEFVDPVPCYAAIMCERCSGTCRRCGVAMDYDNAREHGLIYGGDGRPMCSDCWLEVE